MKVLYKNEDTKFIIIRNDDNSETIKLDSVLNTDVTVLILHRHDLINENTYFNYNLSDLSSLNANKIIKKYLTTKKLKKQHRLDYYDYEERKKKQSDKTNVYNYCKKDGYRKHWIKKSNYFKLTDIDDIDKINSEIKDIFSNIIDVKFVTSELINEIVKLLLKTQFKMNTFKLDNGESIIFK